MSKSTKVKRTVKKSSLKNKRKIKNKQNNRKQTKKVKRKTKSKSKSKSKSKRKVKTKSGGGKECLECNSNNFKSYMEKLKRDLSGGGFDCNGTGYSVDPSITILKEPVITKFD